MRWAGWHVSFVPLTTHAPQQLPAYSITSSARRVIIMSRKIGADVRRVKPTDLCVGAMDAKAEITSANLMLSREANSQPLSKPKGKNCEKRKAE